ncbi:MULTISPECIES: DUF881 domain-containing protein [unclassified Streptomyces]|uniref:DUF881 domain-containing protein n=1 Tax=unclassified Streptomyces TaxID=2593676 RepID=UPI0022B6DB6A|nr:MULTISPECIES: DUF881 domain-containing protein [unclassified Streptomyces]MCZ7415553.1 DUF881 domain-containing protein [Streptomyces sp. WMMC897]MCZ7434635.1 DUF881 domain-containing protein [Streptomyces sp. WMMC1477]
MSEDGQQEPGRPKGPADGERPGAGPGGERREPARAGRPQDRAAGAEERAEPRAEELAGASAEGGEGTGTGTDEMTGRQRLVAGLWPPRLNRNQLIAASLLFVLGLGLAIQVRSTSEDNALRGARQEDLVRILDELDDRTTRLEGEKERLENQRSELENSSNQAEEARRQRTERDRQLGILAGTVAARGPGIEVRISGPDDVVEADRLLDAIQELRAAGAEAVQINDVRVVADTYFTNAEGGVNIDGQSVSPPYVFEVIGRPQDLEPALKIPGGVVQSLQGDGATVTITPSENVVVDAVVPPQRPEHGRSSSQ